MNKILGLDLGTKTVGIAMSDTLGMFAHGVETYRFEGNSYKKALAHVVALIDAHGIKDVVLGLPKHMNGDIGIGASRSIKFKAMLEQERDINVIMIDERLTTQMMQKSLISSDVSRKKRKEVIDKMAAVVILQSYLDAKK